MSEVRYYLISAAVLAQLQEGPYVHFNSTSIPPDHTQHLIWVNWRAEDAHAREVFEADPTVTALGDPWEPLPALGVAPLVALGAVEDQLRAKAGLPTIATNIATDEVAAKPDTVASALRKAAPRHRP